MNDTVDAKPFDADGLIVGAGLSDLTRALALRRAGVDAVVRGDALAEVLRGRKGEEYLDEYGRLRRPAARQVLARAGGIAGVMWGR